MASAGLAIGSGPLVQVLLCSWNAMNDHPTTATPTAPISADTTLATIALRSDAHASVLDRHHLDFCCRGSRTLSQACTTSGLDVARVIAELDAEAVARSAHDWNEGSVAKLIDFIVETHHSFTRQAFARITPLLQKVANKHGEHHPELARISVAFGALVAELGPHLIREERVLFPYIRALASLGGAPPPPFGTVQNPVRMMLAEHEHAGELLAEITAASRHFVAPADGCASFKALYAALAELRLDLLKHIALENNVLFPRALALEEEQRMPAPVRY
jgi:regulator of cell morphogenesis and NO signaling